MMRTIAATLVLAVVSCSDGARERLSTHSYRGQRPPELRVEARHWINTSMLAVSLSALRGRVVWLEFSFLN
jgi:hypothetical protein